MILHKFNATTDLPYLTWTNTCKCQFYGVAKVTLIRSCMEGFFHGVELFRVWGCQGRERFFTLLNWNLIGIFFLYYYFYHHNKRDFRTFNREFLFIIIIFIIIIIGIFAHLKGNFFLSLFFIIFFHHNSRDFCTYISEFVFITPPILFRTFEYHQRICGSLTSYFTTGWFLFTIVKENISAPMRTLMPPSPQKSLSTTMVQSCRFLQVGQILCFFFFSNIQLWSFLRNLQVDLQDWHHLVPLWRAELFPQVWNLDPRRLQDQPYRRRPHFWWRVNARHLGIQCWDDLIIMISSNSNDDNTTDW